MNMNVDDAIQFVCDTAEKYLSTCIQDNSIQLIYLDPPFFKQEELRQYCEDTKTVYCFNDKWESLEVYLDFIKDILIKCKAKLSTHGLIFLHCDTSASHHLRVLMDTVFDQKFFVNEIIWAYKRWSNSAFRLLESHQNIFVYSKSKDYKFNRIMTEYSPTTNVDQILQSRTRDKNGIVKYKRDGDNNIVSAGEKQ